MHKLNQAAVTLGGIALLLMAMIGAADVIGSGFGWPVVGAYELIETLMVITIFMSVSAAQQQGVHINVELIAQLLGPRGQAVMALFGLLCSGALFLLIAYFAWFGTLRSFESGEIRQGQLGFPVWPARMALALGSSLMVLQCSMQFVSILRALLAGKVAVAQVTPPADLRSH
jgi:TRAP-type C4-dicarboxylate transport system permease small subunit